MILDIDAVKKTIRKINFNSKVRLRIYRKIGTMIKYGIPLQRVLEMLYMQASSNGQKPTDNTAVILKAWVREIKNGHPLSIAASSWIPDNERMMIEAGEESQSLPDSLDDLVKINQGMQKIRATVVGGIIYPIILLGFICGVLFLFGQRVFPAFDSVHPMEKWTGLAASMAGLSNFVENYLLIVVGSMVAVFVIITSSFPRWTGRLRTKFDEIPPWSIYRLVSGAGFLMSLGALISSGVQTSRSLEKINKHANPWLKERISATLHYVYSGLNVGKALKKSGYNYPDREIIEDLVVYSDLPSFSEMLDILGKEWLTDATDRVSRQTKTLNGVALLLLFGIIAWLFTGLYAIVDQITQSTGAV
jgi:type II secretory pathway component PulF